jgi:anti-sigma factor RsiW
MNCEDFRHAVGAEPATTQLDVLEHAASCSECARYRSEMRSMDGLIRKALDVDVSAPAIRPAPRQPAFNWRIAASVLVSMVVFSLAWLAYPRQSLADDIVAHVLLESRALLPTEATANRERVEKVLRYAGVELDATNLNVAHALVCIVRGRATPHLVVRTGNGPVTVLVMPHESAITKPQRFDEQGFSGTLMPAPQGVIAVLGRDVPVDEVAQEVMRALRYSR